MVYKENPHPPFPLLCLPCTAGTPSLLFIVQRAPEGLNSNPVPLPEYRFLWHVLCARRGMREWEGLHTRRAGNGVPGAEENENELRQAVSPATPVSLGWCPPGAIPPASCVYSQLGGSPGPCKAHRTGQRILDRVLSSRGHAYPGRGPELTCAWPPLHPGQVTAHLPTHLPLSP